MPGRDAGILVSNRPLKLPHFSIMPAKAGIRPSIDRSQASAWMDPGLRRDDVKEEEVTARRLC
jgi:hypothetical protein